MTNKKKLKFILLAMGLFLLVYGAIAAYKTVLDAGAAAVFGMSFILLVYGLRLEKMLDFKRLTRCLILLFAATGIVVLFINVYGMFDNASYEEDAVIVLGAGIRGETVSLALGHRLDKAVEYSAKNPDAIIVVSGGQGNLEDIPEALAMERYLVKKGVSSSRIIKEAESTSTYENFMFSKAILDEHFEGTYTTAFITNGFHVFRAEQLSRIVGLESARIHARTEWYTLITSNLRECMAIVKMILLNVIPSFFLSASNKNKS